MNHPVRVQALKYNGHPYRHWSASLRQKVGPLIILEAAFEQTVSHKFLGTIPQGTLSTEYYWTDRWFSIFRLARQHDRQLICFYCNVNTPAEFDGSTLRFVDLDVDLLVMPDLSCHVLDADELESNAQRYNYPLDLVRSAHQALAELHHLARTRQFPFNEIEMNPKPRHADDLDR